jgi:hypothetical protein
MSHNRGYVYSFAFCEVALLCLSPSGKCTKGLAKGAACKAGAANLSCSGIDGLYCKPAMLPTPDGACTEFTLATAGDACGLSTTPLDFALCVDQSQCVGAQGTKRGTCSAYLTDGATCGTGTEPVACTFPAKCREGKCAMLKTAVCK